MRKYYVKTGIILCILLTILSAGCTAATKIGPGSPSAIVWNDIIYGYSGREVSESELGKQLGEIKRIKKPMPAENGDSNDAPVGSKIFEIKGIDMNEAVSIKIDGKFYRIIKKGYAK